MHELIDQVVAAVAEEAEHLERFLGLLDQQQRHLIEGHVGAVEDNVHRQESALIRSRQLEDRRRTLVASLSSRLAEASGEGVGAGCATSAGSEEHTLQKLTMLLSDEYGRRLRRLRARMLAATAKITRTKEQNEFLIRKSLTQIDETMRLLSGMGQQSESYEPSAETKVVRRAVVDHVG